MRKIAPLGTQHLAARLEAALDVAALRRVQREVEPGGAARPVRELGEGRVSNPSPAFA
jgi:hypothetical protein